MREQLLEFGIEIPHRNYSFSDDGMRYVESAVGHNTSEDSSRHNEVNCNQTNEHSSSSKTLFVLEGTETCTPSKAKYLNNASKKRKIHSIQNEDEELRLLPSSRDLMPPPKRPIGVTTENVTTEMQEGNRMIGNSKKSSNTHSSLPQYTGRQRQNATQGDYNHIISMVITNH
jgi:hypothetical protein